jgi:uncharacterized protein (TIGR01777 family)
MKTVLITGGTGLIGKRLSFLLQSKGYEVRLLSRDENPDAQYKTFVWDIHKRYIDEKAFENLDCIVHLAGAGIADKKWSEARKKVIIDSRVESTKLLLEYVQKLHVSLEAFVSSSAVGYYGSITSEIIFKEEDNPGNDYLAEVCKLWEAAIFEFQSERIRTVAIRTGIVLSQKGGALQKMKTPVITALGSGSQYIPWIHIDDLCGIYLKAIEDSHMEGSYNGVAPEHETNKTFSKKLAKVFKRPFLPIGAPAFILKLVFGEMATLLLNGSRISSQKILDAGFDFSFPTLNEALADLAKK